MQTSYRDNNNSSSKPSDTDDGNDSSNSQTLRGVAAVCLERF